MGIGYDPLYVAALLVQVNSGEGYVQYTYPQAKQFVFGALNIYCPAVAS